MKVYIAGPDVFRPDAATWAAEVHAQCRALGLEALVPLDGEASTAAGIYDNNIAMIAAADVVVANLNPFRGAEPDSGTCFEVGFAAALGKPVIGYASDLGALHERVERLCGPVRCEREGWVDADGMRIENFGLPLNLMLAVPACLIAGDLTAALGCIAPA